MRIELEDSGSDALNIVHFAGENDGGDVVDARTVGQAVSFEADGFSVYAVVDGPGAIPIGWRKITSLDELEKAHIGAVLATSDTLDQAARTLGIDASTLYRKRKQYNL